MSRASRFTAGEFVPRNGLRPKRLRELVEVLARREPVDHPPMPDLPVDGMECATPACWCHQAFNDFEQGLARLFKPPAVAVPDGLYPPDWLNRARAIEEGIAVPQDWTSRVRYDRYGVVVR